ITQKGQVTIPKNIRDKLGVKSGSSVRFKIFEGKCIVEKEVEENKAGKWVGYLEGQKRTDELIEELRGKIKDTDPNRSK
ncbi:MAG: AbrB/MazE/SpoVT family DNA-binding domain-containing protein, partial [Thermodesulfobacteriota bacterium]